MKIQSTRYDGVLCELVDQETGEAAHRDAALTCSHGDEFFLVGGRAPHKPGSTGFVWVEPADSITAISREYYPKVFGLEWRPV